VKEVQCKKSNRQQRYGHAREGWRESFARPRKLARQINGRGREPPWLISSKLREFEDTAEHVRRLETEAAPDSCIELAGGVRESNLFKGHHKREEDTMKRVHHVRKTGADGLIRVKTGGDNASKRKKAIAPKRNGNQEGGPSERDVLEWRGHTNKPMAHGDGGKWAQQLPRKEKKRKGNTLKRKDPGLKLSDN